MASPPDLVVWPEGAVIGFELEGRARGADGARGDPGASPRRARSWSAGARGRRGGAATPPSRSPTRSRWGATTSTSWSHSASGGRSESAPRALPQVFGLLGLPLLANTVPGDGPAPSARRRPARRRHLLRVRVPHDHRGDGARRCRGARSSSPTTPGSPRRRRPAAPRHGTAARDRDAPVAAPRRQRRHHRGRRPLRPGGDELPAGSRRAPGALRHQRAVTPTPATPTGSPGSWPGVAARAGIARLPRR